jgi:TolB-like protein
MSDTSIYSVPAVARPQPYSRKNPPLEGKIRYTRDKKGIFMKRYVFLIEFIMITTVVFASGEYEDSYDYDQYDYELQTEISTPAPETTKEAQDDQAAWGQQPVVAVMPFEVRNNVVTAVDAENFTNYFSGELASRRILRMSSRADIDAAIKKEFVHQQSDWSDPNKTAKVGKVLNADWLVIGVVSTAGRRIMLNISLFEMNTREQLPGVTSLAEDVDDAYDKIYDMADAFAERISGTATAATERAAEAEVARQRFEMSVNGNSITITKYKGPGGPVTIPKSVNGRNVTSIGHRAFYECTSLSSVTIPDSVTSIGKSAFDSCSNLASVTIPSSVIDIGEKAFYYCESLVSVTIPPGVTTISERAFSECSSLTSVTIPSSVTDIGDYVFFQCYSLRTISVSTLNQYYEDRDGVVFSKYGESLYIYPAGNTRTAYTIPDNVTDIGKAAFAGCYRLASVKIPSTVTDIGNEAFAFCSNLTSVTIPNSVTSIGYTTFGYCDKLISVTIPNSVTSIGESAFRCCSSLPSVTIPPSVTSMGIGAFAYCDELNQATRRDIERRFGSEAFRQ